jgi:hypothetical protein
MAKVLGINRVTLDRWRKRYSELKEASEMGKEIADEVIVGSLYDRAKGSITTDKKTITNPDMSVRVEETVKQIPPDTVACIFWLKNRRPAEWRDKQQTEITGKDGEPLIPAYEMSDEEIEKRAEAIIQRRAGNP